MIYIISYDMNMTELYMFMYVDLAFVNFNKVEEKRQMIRNKDITEHKGSQHKSFVVQYDSK